jgi:hypothetical protein
VLERDYFTFTDAVDPDEPRADGTGVHGTRMLHKRLSVDVQSPHFYIETDINARFRLPHHKNTGENGLMVLLKARRFNGN